MSAVTEADRRAAEDLRVLLADISGFWFSPDDTAPLCAALARHRETSELKLLEKIAHSSVRALPAERMPAAEIASPAGYDARTPRPRPIAVNS
jgi:hypothetical protein